MDLSPREHDAEPITATEVLARRRRRLWMAAALFVVVVGFIVVRALGDATLYYYNADEAVEQREDLGERRFRLQGRVVAGTAQAAGTNVEFSVEFNGVRVPVVHTDDPPELFQDDIPVILEGNWAEDGSHFDSDLMIVKHTNQYEADYSDRIRDAERGSDQPTGEQ